MGERIIEGIWDCKYCRTQQIGGLQKYCPNCGHPQDKDTKFRVGTKKRYLTEDEINTVGTAPDWNCDYCSTLNNAKFIYCKNCGASRSKDTKDYFDLRREEQVKAVKETESFATNDCDDKFENEYEDNAGYVDKTEHVSESNDKNDSNVFASVLKFAKFGGIIALVSLIIVGFLYLLTPHQYDGIVSEKVWNRNITIQEYKTVTESAWDYVPVGGRLLYTEDEIRTYESVFSHYETKSRQVPKQVFDGYEEYVSYSDNGNGTFTEHVSRTPKYRTEYKTEYYEEAVYKDVPVYDTKYYYEIERWVYNRTEKSNGIDTIPYWPDYTLDSNERVSTKNESYEIKVYVADKDKTYTYSCTDQLEWEQYKLEQSVSITVTNLGFVTEIH